MPMRYLRFLTLICVVLLPSLVIAQDAVPIPTSMPPAQVITVWLPENIAAPSNNFALPLLEEQTAAFEEAQANITVSLRVKEVGTPGGIMPALRTGTLVAPSAMPTITLLRRQDLVAAELDGFIQSVDQLVPSNVVSQLDNTLQIGQIDERLFGVPYVVELLHMAYREQDGLDYTSWDYESFLDRAEPFYMPAGANSGMNNVLLLQYLADGGEINDNNMLTFNEDVLLNILEFYESATDDTLLDGLVMNYTSYQDYAATFINGEVDKAVVSSTTYLRQVADDSDLKIAPIPTASGSPATLLDGWSWVIVTSDPQQQALAMDYILWMMTPQRQAAFARTVTMLPSQQNAIELGIANDVDARPYLEMLSNAVIPITESQGGALARAMQNALSQVVTGQRTAEMAIETVTER